MFWFVQMLQCYQLHCQSMLLTAGHSVKGVLSSLKVQPVVKESASNTFLSVKKDMSPRDHLSAEVKVLS